MKILDRYLLAAVMRAILTTLLVLTLLIMVISFIEEVDDVGEGQYVLLDAFTVALLSIPRAIYEAFPISALIGALLGLGALANHSELLAMRAAGMSLARIVAAVLKAGLLLVVAVFVVGELVAPDADRYADRLRLEKQHDQITMISRYGFWARDGHAFVNIKTILPGERLRDIFIYEFSNAGELRLITRAEEAEYQGQGWVLRKVRQSSIGLSGVQHRDLAEATWKSFLDPALLSVLVVDPLMLPVWDIHRYARLMRENRQNAKNYEVAFWAKVATPFSTLAMLILAVPFVLGSLRTAGMGQRVFFGALLGSAFYFISKGFSFMAVVYDFYPVSAAVFPVSLLLLASFFFYRRLGD